MPAKIGDQATYLVRQLHRDTNTKFNVFDCLMPLASILVEDQKTQALFLFPFQRLDMTSGSMARRMEALTEIRRLLPLDKNFQGNQPLWKRMYKLMIGRRSGADAELAA